MSVNGSEAPTREDQEFDSNALDVLFVFNIFNDFVWGCHFRDFKNKDQSHYGVGTSPFKAALDLRMSLLERNAIDFDDLQERYRHVNSLLMDMREYRPNSDTERA